jgi:hypothetical protein
MSKGLLRLLVMAAVAMVAAAVAAPAMAAPGDAFSCRATAASIALLGGAPLEPVVANNPQDPCRSEDKSNADPTQAGTASVGALQAQTVAADDGVIASARAADLVVNLGGVLVGVEGINATAAYSCSTGTPVGTSSSNVAKVTILGGEINLPDPSKPAKIDLGAVLTIYLNKRTVVGTRIVQQAVVIESKLLNTTIVLAEAAVDSKGQCPAGSGTPTTPQSTGGQTIFLPSPYVAGINTGGFVPGACVSEPKTIRVRGRGIKQVQFSLDGKRVKTVNGSQDSSYTIDPDTLSVGSHRLKAVVIYQRRVIKNKTLSLSFRRCAPSGVDVPLTANFGKCVVVKVTASRAGKVFVGVYSGKQSRRAFGQKLLTFTAPGTKSICMPVPNRARNFDPRTTRAFATAVVRINGKIVTRKLQVA